MPRRTTLAVTQSALLTGVFWLLGSRFHVPLFTYWRSLANYPLSSNISSVFHVVIALGLAVRTTNLTKSLETLLEDAFNSLSAYSKRDKRSATFIF